MRHATRLLVLILTSATLLTKGVLLLWMASFGNPLDLWWVTEGTQEASVTFLRTASANGSAFILLGFAALVFLRLVYLLTARIPTRQLAIALAAILVTEVALQRFFSIYVPLVSELRSLHLSANTREGIGMWFVPFQSTRRVDENSWDLVLVLQMESANGLILHAPPLTKTDRHLVDAHWEVLGGLSRRGTVFPRLWSLGVQTNRAYEAIYCGVGVNLNSALSFNRARPPQECIPGVLRRNGTSTIFFNSYPDSTFQNFEAFSRTMGFERYVGPVELGVKDPDGWGMDECEFGDALLKFIKDGGLPDLPHQSHLLNVKFSPNHVPFCRPWAPCDATSFDELKTKTRFLRSSLHQLQCVVGFERKLRELLGGRILTILLSDTSWPLGLSEYSSRFNERGVSVDGFLSYGAVLAKDEFPQSTMQVDGNAHFSHLDIGTTLLELTGFGPQMNSLVSLLRGEGVRQEFDSCQPLSQPFGDIELGIVQSGGLSVLNFSRQTVEERSLSPDLGEQMSGIFPLERASGGSFPRFCPRLKKSL